MLNTSSSPPQHRPEGDCAGRRHQLQAVCLFQRRQDAVQVHQRSDAAKHQHRADQRQFDGCALHAVIAQRHARADCTQDDAKHQQRTAAHDEVEVPRLHPAHTQRTGKAVRQRAVRNRGGEQRSIRVDVRHQSTGIDLREEDHQPGKRGQNADDDQRPVRLFPDASRLSAGFGRNRRLHGIPSFLSS